MRAATSASITTSGRGIANSSRVWSNGATSCLPTCTFPHGGEKHGGGLRVFPDGSREAGNFTQGYSGMCPAAKGYQDYVLSWVLDRYIRRYGVDAWYFDSMPVTMFAASRICFSSEHGPRQPHGVGRKRSGFEVRHEFSEVALILGESDQAADAVALSGSAAAAFHRNCRNSLRTVFTDRGALGERAEIDFERPRSIEAAQSADTIAGARQQDGELLSRHRPPAFSSVGV